MNWKRLLALLLAVVIVAAACGEDDEDDANDQTEESPEDAATDEAEDTTGTTETTTTTTEDTTTTTEDGPLFGNEQPRPADSIRMWPSACTGSNFPDAGGEDDRWVGLDKPFVGPGYGGPMYRPGLVLGTADFDPAAAEAENVELVAVPVADVGGPLIDGVPTDGELPGGVNLWWIASADDEELLDPVNLVLALDDPDDPVLEPVYVLTPAGGHMYGPEGAATTGGQDNLPDVGTADDEGKSVGIIDTSFVELPDGKADSVVGHGSFIAGVVRQLVPRASITTVDMELVGENLAVGRGDNSVVLYGPNGIFDFVDTLQLALTIGALNAKDLTFSAINMSFGTYTCRDIEPPALRAVIDSVGETPIFAAAGNDNSDSPWWPAAFYPANQSPYAVGGIKDDGTRWEHSNRGPWVETCELAHNVNADPWVDMDGDGQDDGNERFSWSGTSFASPIAMSRFLVSGQMSGEQACMPS